MRIYFFSRRQIHGMLAVILSVFMAAGVFAVYASQDNAEKTVAPIHYQGYTGEKVVALDINVDWGEEYIPQMLEILAREKVPATFFVTGNWAKKHPDLLRQMADKGHDIANHGNRHLHLSRASDQTIYNELAAAETVIQEVTGKKPVLFSPPYGEIDKRISQIATARGYQVVMWSLDTIDWQRPAPQTITQRITKRLHNDAIVLMHPTEPTVKALPSMISELKDQGYKVKKVGEIIARTNGMNAGDIK